eukprot:10941646-Prorocentrum_lima.AAC.1
MAQLVLADKFCRNTHLDKGTHQRDIALFVDDMIQAGAKESNVKFLKALERSGQCPSQNIRDL